MWLLHANSLTLQKFYGSNIPPYVILSHRWGNEDEEVTFADIGTRHMRRKHGYRKIIELCRVAVQNNHDWVWADTCCIDKKNAVELNEAINSMYKWYENSAFCVAYLEDYQTEYDRLAKSTWFARCWTLQELISPSDVRFYDTKWRCFGSKKSLCLQISKITGIDTSTLYGSNPRRCSVAQRMSWAAGRQATRVEDQAYSLLGLFDISLPMLYGDGDKAFMALQKEILQYSDDNNDQSIFAWDRGIEQRYHGLLARSPSAFAGCQFTRRLPPLGNRCGFSYSGFEVSLDLFSLPCGMNTYLCVLDCTSDLRGSNKRDCIILERSADGEQFARVKRGKRCRISLESTIIDEECDARRRKMLVRQIPRHVSTNMIHGFLIDRIELPDCTHRELGQIRVLPLAKGGRTRRHGSTLLTIPMNDWGTVGNISIPLPEAVYSPQHLKWIKLGFDTEFRPRCRLGTVASLRDTSFDNNWLCGPPESSLPVQVTSVYNLAVDDIADIDDREAKQHYRSFHLSGPKLLIEFEIVDCPADIDTRELPKCGPGPWKIWSLRIEKLGDFYEEEDRRIRRKESRRYHIKQGLTAAVAIAAAKVLIEA